MADFTKGPWFIEDTPLRMGDSVSGVQIWAYHGPRIALTEQQNVGSRAELANAALIATAPDLHAALTALVEEWEEHNTIDPTAPPEPGTVAWLYMIAREVLAKAEGR